jgi:hypothetical protein
MVHRLRAMPIGVLVFLAYGFLMLAFLGLTLPLVVAQAVEAPISITGLIWMLLLAYLIFTLTLTLQRKQAGYALGIGLASLTIPLAAILWLSPAGLAGGLVAMAVAIALIWLLRRPASRRWFSEP